MTTPSTWTVTLTFEDDDGGTTWARAVLDSTPEDVLGPGEVLAAEGRAVRWPDHPAVAGIGREAAAARALVELGHRLGDRALDDAFANAYGRLSVGPGSSGPKGPDHGAETGTPSPA